MPLTKSLLKSTLFLVLHLSMQLCKEDPGVRLLVLIIFLSFWFLESKLVLCYTYFLWCSNSVYLAE